jgi:hypothetical protein
MCGILKVTMLGSPRTGGEPEDLWVETGRAQEPFEISIFGALNKTWGTLHPVVESCLKSGF